MSFVSHFRTSSSKTNDRVRIGCHNWPWSWPWQNILSLQNRFEKGKTENLKFAERKPAMRSPYMLDRRIRVPKQPTFSCWRFLCNFSTWCLIWSCKRKDHEHHVCPAGLFRFDSVLIQVRKKATNQPTLLTSNICRALKTWKNQRSPKKHHGSPRRFKGSSVTCVEGDTNPKGPWRIIVVGVPTGKRTWTLTLIWTKMHRQITKRRNRTRNFSATFAKENTFTKVLCEGTTAQGLNPVARKANQKNTCVMCVGGSTCTRNPCWSTTVVHMLRRKWIACQVTMPSALFASRSTAIVGAWEDTSAQKCSALRAASPSWLTPRPCLIGWQCTGETSSARVVESHFSVQDGSECTRGNTLVKNRTSVRSARNTSDECLTWWCICWLDTGSTWSLFWNAGRRHPDVLCLPESRITQCLAKPQFCQKLCFLWMEMTFVWTLCWFDKTCIQGILKASLTCRFENNIVVCCWNQKVWCCNHCVFVQELLLRIKQNFFLCTNFLWWAWITWCFVGQVSFWLNAFPRPSQRILVRMDGIRRQKLVSAKYFVRS